MKIKKDKKSEFVKELESSKKRQYDKSLPLEVRQEKRYDKLDVIFEEIANKENKYLLYCPDIPFACSLVKIIYEYAKIMKDAGFNVVVLHEVDGFVPKWLDFEWVKDIPKGYLSSKKERTQPEWKFAPSDTIIIPEGFFSIMKSFYQFNPLHKVVLALGYNGLASMEPGVNWGVLGFKDVICISEDIKDKYQQVFPALNYYVTSYVVNEELLTPVNSNEVAPTIGLMIRDRELASKIVNIFTNKYPHFNYFQFKVLKKQTVKQYCEELRKCAVIVFADDKSAIPAPLVEAVCAKVPVITHQNNFLKTFVGIESFNVIDISDEFAFADYLAEFCNLWSSNSTALFQTTGSSADLIIDNFRESNVKESLIKVVNLLQEEKIKTFTAIDEMVQKGELDNYEKK